MICDAHLHAVVIAGGSGVRFWPLSRRAMPKQLLNLSGDDTLLHATFARVRPLVGPNCSWMVVGAAHADGCRRAAPEVPHSQVLVEPRGRNTAPAVALAALHLAHHAQCYGTHDDTVMAVLPADHHVADPDAFCVALARAAELARLGPIVTLGITPTRPETGFGYIEQGAPDARIDGAFVVSRFVEKPQRERAEQFLQAGGFLWNAGIFVMRPDVLLSEVARQLPALYAAMQDLDAHLGASGYEDALARAYADMQGVSIDYGVMEHARHVAVIPCDCGWSDVGSWDALGSVVPPDGDGNVVRGRAVLEDAKGCTVYASDDHVVAVAGLEDIVVVHTPDATLVLPASRAQQVKHLLGEVEARGWEEYL